MRRFIPKKRQSVIVIFNDLTSEVRVLLASTKACSEGISLVGALRVVLIDVLWCFINVYQRTLIRITLEVST